MTSSVRCIVFIALATMLPACRDYEQRARATGARVRDEIATRCAAETAKSDAGFEHEHEETCIDQRCREACAGGDVAKGFAATCVLECRAQATCATDADCTAGLRCIAVAPRVRRCGTLVP
jgi:hypothetical protein